MEKYKPYGDWRKITKPIIPIINILLKTGSIMMNYFVKENIFIPSGMLKTLEKLFSHSKCYQSYRPIPCQIK